MAIQEFYVGSVGPLQYNDADVYPDAEPMHAFRATQLYIEEDPTEDYHVARFVDINGLSANADWTLDLDTWVYVSATSFKIAGKDVASRFPIGAKITFSQTTGGTKYFYVIASAFSTNTTVTVTAGSDYVINNEAITGPKYSYASCPTGFPHWFNFAESWTGFSAAPTGGLCRFCIEGRTVRQVISRAVGTSNDNFCTVSLAVPAISLAGYVSNCMIMVCKTTWQDYSGYAHIPSTATEATLYIKASAASTDWNATGDKGILGELRWEI
jgi:hypothetical protein